MDIPFLGIGKAAEKMKGKGYAPADRVRQLMSRSFSETDVIDVLRREGFSPDEIDTALTQALKGGVRGEQGAPFQEQSAFPSRQEQFQQEQQQQPTSLLPTVEDIKPRQPAQLIVPETSLPAEYYQSYPTEDYIDYTINERMTDVQQSMNEFAIRYNELEKRLDEISNRLNMIVQGRSGEQQTIISKVEGASEGMEDISSRLASLEKAFKETLPALIESVRALCDLVQRMKREG